MAVLGIDIGGTKIAAGLVKEKQVLKTFQVPTKAHGTKEEVIEQICELIDELSKEETIEAIGIGAPSIVDVNSGTVYEVTNIPSWDEVPLAKILQQKYNIPIYVNNDANCFALGQFHFANPNACKDLVAITLGTGLGTGVISGGKLLIGHNCGVGELCEVPYCDSNFDVYCSAQFFETQFGQSAAQLHELAKQGDEKALAAFTNFGMHLGHCVAISIFAYDPQMIVFGGSIAKARKFFEVALDQQLRKLLYERTYSRLEIKFSSLENSAILGAASLCY